MIAFMQQLVKSIPRHKGKWILAVKLIATVWLVSYLTGKVGGVNLLQVITSADMGFMALAILLMVPNILMQFLKWKYLAKQVIGTSDDAAVGKAFFMGILFGSFTPGRLGEYLGRKLALKDEGLLEITIVTFLDKIFNLFFVAGVGALSLTLYLYVTIDVPAIAATALFVTIAMLFFLFMHLLISDIWWNNSLVKYISRFRLLKKYRERFLILKDLDKGLINRLMLFSGGIYIIIVMQYALLVMSFSGEHDFLKYAWGAALFFYTKAFIPAFTWGELGVREAVSIFYMSSFGLPEAVGFNASLFIFLINIFLPSLPGVWFLLRNK